MSEELKRLEHAQKALNDAKEMNAAEALSISQNMGDVLGNAIDFGALVGRAQMAASIAKITDAVSLSILKEIKETKQYKLLKGTKFQKQTAVGNNFVTLKGTWEEFCQMVGSSKSTIDERLSNLDTFGEQALQSMQSIGMTTKDLRRLRQLPQEELTAIVEGEVIKVQDRDEALEIIEELSAKHRQEKQALQSEVTKLTQDKESNERLLADKDKKINSLSKKLDTPLSLAQTRQKEEELNSKLLNQLNIAATSVDGGFARLFDAIETINDNPHPTDIDQACEDTLFRLLERFLNLSAELGISAHVKSHLEQWHAENQFFVDNEG
ncbi:MarR family transcriptional regulator [Vibrio fluvialis]|uniref:MarR family transcriptional regulator n=1 Tax=Vibrio TaxID=662 RepID=UPI00159470CA|nr:MULTISPECIES: MarR family transcriptional regulator [Vibrio]EGR0723405.1 MarR family transcriptional regulator [Vibrio cholerae]EKO3910347.1 MarR family transcriptional regulator [Vibrio fluvialis]MBL4279714.1 MarR family transcriptional regulator [Vibrio fluvialis]MBY8109842.1 MarR family transcriptional regulator [Vibrio fluvialis]MBY8293208.1 MarR family transcriptional regulator [Vibrio fluvialis]